MSDVFAVFFFKMVASGIVAGRRVEGGREGEVDTVLRSPRGRKVTFMT